MKAVIWRAKKKAKDITLYRSLFEKINYGGLPGMNWLNILFSRWP
jgi:hypothetical protein